ncbi:hypothetical protein JD969_10175 [Planctomycetota bacterium]|nr:hypothetical protein JD969_10175 [Planctomycetota bacterium]
MMKVRIGTLSYQLHFSHERLYFNKREVFSICRHDLKRIFISPITPNQLYRQILTHLACSIYHLPHSPASYRMIMTPLIFHRPLPLPSSRYISSPPFSPPTDISLLSTETTNHTPFAKWMTQQLMRTNDQNLLHTLQRILSRISKNLDLQHLIYLDHKHTPALTNSEPITTDELTHFKSISQNLSNHELYYISPSNPSHHTSPLSSHPPCSHLMLIASTVPTPDSHIPLTRGRLLLTSNSPLNFNTSTIYLLSTITHLIATLTPLHQIPKPKTSTNLTTLRICKSPTQT